MTAEFLVKNHDCHCAEIRPDYYDVDNQAMRAEVFLGRFLYIDEG